MAERDLQKSRKINRATGRRSGHCPGKLMRMDDYARLGREAQTPPMPPTVTLEDSSWDRMKPWLEWQLRYGNLIEDLISKASKPEPFDKSATLKQLTEHSGDYMSIWEHAKAYDKGNQDAFLEDSKDQSDLFGPITLLMRTQSRMLAKLTS